MPSQVPAQVPSAFSTLQVPEHSPLQVPSHVAAAVSSQRPVQLPSHSRFGAVPTHLTSALAPQSTSTPASAVQEPLHSTVALGGVTVPSQRAVASTVALADTLHSAG